MAKNERKTKKTNNTIPNSAQETKNSIWKQHMVRDHHCCPLITNIVPSVDSGLLAINFYTPSKFISPCLMPQIARRGEITL